MKEGYRRNNCPLKVMRLFPLQKKQLRTTNKKNFSINADCTHATAKEYIT
jgi:hypothetical protein